MELIRIGDKIINRGKIIAAIDNILDLRKRGFSQQETAARMGLDRSVVSRLEQLGEIRKGKKIALIGFPVLNKAELLAVAREEGVDLVLLMTENERWSYIKEKSGIQLFDNILELIMSVRLYDVIIVIGSNHRIEVTESVLGKSVIGIEIGKSPLSEDRYVNPELLKNILSMVRKDKRKGELNEASC